MSIKILIILLIVCLLFRNYTESMDTIPYNPAKYNKVKMLFKKVIPILNRHYIEYWADYGTLLGTIREQRLLPWDYDVDVCVMNSQIPKLMHSSFEQDLNEVGLTLRRSKNNTFKIYTLANVGQNKSKDLYLKRVHFDLYVFQDKGDTICRECKYQWGDMKCYSSISKQCTLKSTIFPLKTTNLVVDEINFSIFIPNKPIARLEYSYGKDWRTPKSYS